MTRPEVSAADEIRLTLPARAAFADVAAETAATVALRFGFGGADVDRLRRDVTAAFASAAVGQPDPVLVELFVARDELTVHIDRDPNPAGRLRRRQEPA